VHGYVCIAGAHLILLVLGFAYIARERRDRYSSKYAENNNNDDEFNERKARAGFLSETRKNRSFKGNGGGIDKLRVVRAGYYSTSARARR
jgi:hypothetical protein